MKQDPLDKLLKKLKAVPEDDMYDEMLILFDRCNLLIKQQHVVISKLIKLLKRRRNEKAKTIHKNSGTA